MKETSYRVFVSTKNYILIAVLCTSFFCMVSCEKNDTTSTDPFLSLMDTVSGSYTVTRTDWSWSYCSGCPTGRNSSDSLYPESLILHLSKANDSMVRVVIVDSLTGLTTYDSLDLPPFNLGTPENFAYDPDIKFGDGLFGPGTHNSKLLSLYANDSIQLVFDAGGHGSSSGKTYRGYKSH